ncbi:DNA-directed RNA polymerase subunit E'' [Candidatus Woesearchaeota archaeon CG10_big_fil_rev_8_21_14_0_10_45_16]|nr:MAG: DNA-directed RNA polymerase subunit E'' [Candidatus Woesearchaeota archaeon CG10_big_fil_rev_8_21_14_0_10_45_16]
MARRLVNKRTKKFIESKDEAGSDAVTDNWKGRIYITDPKESMIAKELNIEESGEYAIKVQ